MASVSGTSSIIIIGMMAPGWLGAAAAAAGAAAGAGVAAGTSAAGGLVWAIVAREQPRSPTIERRLRFSFIDLICFGLRPRSDKRPFSIPSFSSSQSAKRSIHCFLCTVTGTTTTQTRRGCPALRHAPYSPYQQRNIYSRQARRHAGDPRAALGSQPQLTALP